MGKLYNLWDMLKEIEREFEVKEPEKVLAILQDCLRDGMIQKIKRNGRYYYRWV